MKMVIRNEVLESEMTAIEDGYGNKISYKELSEKARKLACHMGDRSLVFILCDHQIETVEFIYLTLYLNRVPLLLSSDMDGKLLDNLISLYRPQYIYCAGSRRSTDAFSGSIELELTSHVLLKTGYEKYSIHPDVCVLLSTSGTTGSAKLVKISYDNLYYNSEYISRHMNIHGGQKGCSPLPINHIYGFAFCFWHWHCGATLFITDEMVIGKKFRELFLQAKINNFAATPYVYAMLQKVQFWDELTMEHLNFAISSGGQLPENDQIDLVRLMKNKFWIGYGQTECSSVIICMNFEEHNIKLGAVGKVFENTDLDVVIDEDTQELIIKSNNVCMGYASCREHLMEGDVNHGIIRTGDMAYMDEDGCIYLRGRLTRYVKILEKRTSLDDIEQYLNSEYLDADFACTGCDNNILIFYTGVETDKNEAVKALLDRRMKLPKKYISCYSLEEIPRYNTGKVNYKMLEEIADGYKG